jgi:predicted AlkP superfamily pyrophosphatase or phosphodiesterase
MKRTAVINVVGLTNSLIGQHTPRIAEFLKHGTISKVVPAFPAVTCAAQSTYLTGKTASEHSIVGNGWFNRELSEVQFWKQSNHVVHGEKIWDALRARLPGFTCAKLFWWFNMYSSADYSITPRPMYPADGRKVFDIYSWPYSIREEIKKDLGEFPFPCFWGPAAGMDSPKGKADAASRWIAESATWIENKFQPTLNLIYLPHLDYNLQRHGTCEGTADSPLPADGAYGVKRTTNPAIHRDLREIDSIVGDLIDFFAKQSVQVILLSEYGITNVNTPVHLNREFRKRGWLAIKDEIGLEILDCGASKVFAVADHQVAHVYINDRLLENEVRSLLEKTDGVANVLGTKEKISTGIDHPRAGDLIALAKENAWFTYYYWLDDRVAPDFARTVDIHRKPGYDPVELFLDPAQPFIKAKIAWRLMQKKLGFRMLMDVIPLDATLVKGSHGARPKNPDDWPVFISNSPRVLPSPQMEAREVYQEIMKHLMR